MIYILLGIMISGLFLGVMALSAMLVYMFVRDEVLPDVKKGVWKK